MKQNRIVFIDFLRIFACFCVLFIHSPGNLLCLEYGLNSPRFWIYQVLSIVSRSGVPIFFMISGAVLINKEEGIKDTWKNRIPRIFAILLIFSAAAYIGSAAVDRDFSISTFFMKLYSSYTNVAYWYLDAYIALLVSLPFIKAIARNITEEQFFYMILVVFVFYELRKAGEYFFFNGNLSVNPNFVPNWMFASIVLYPCLGYFITYKLDINKLQGKQWILYLSSILCIILSSLLSAYYLSINVEPQPAAVGNIHKCFEMVLSLNIFLGAKLYFETRELSVKVKNNIIFVASYTFGIYLVHMFILKLLQFTSLQSFLVSVLGSMKMLAAIIYLMTVFIISAVIVFMAKKALEILYAKRK